MVFECRNNTFHNKNLVSVFFFIISHRSDSHYCHASGTQKLSRSSEMPQKHGWFNLSPRRLKEAWTKPKNGRSVPSCPAYPNLISTNWDDVCRLSRHNGVVALNMFGRSLTANKFPAVVRRDWDGLGPSAEDTSPATEASCALARSLPLVTVGFHALTSNYGWESFRMEASPDWAQ